MNVLFHVFNFRKSFRNKFFLLRNVAEKVVAAEFSTDVGAGFVDDFKVRASVWREEDLMNVDQGKSFGIDL